MAWTATVRNLVLRRLAELDRLVFSRLADDLEPLLIVRGDVLAPAPEAPSVYFVDSGLVSLVASTRRGQSIELAVVGREGVAGIGDALGRKAMPYRQVVQLSGLAYRAPNGVIREHILTCSALHALLMDYSQSVMHQLAQSVLCSRFHTSVQRLARWLLLMADRAGTNRFELTHDSVAQMVGAPRAAVSEAAARLRRTGTIDYRRGVLKILQPKRLQGIACECYERSGSISITPR
jgi:CRP-like cAMP-binding protein